MNVPLDPINVHLMPHVQTRVAHTLVPVIISTLEMEELVSRMNALLDHIHVHLMPLVSASLAHSSVYATLALLGMEELAVTLMNVLR